MGNSLKVNCAGIVKLSILFGLVLWLAVTVGCSFEGSTDAGLPRNPADIAPSLAKLGAESLRAKKGQGKGQDKVTICHNGRTIQVAAPAVQGHLKHGDSLGACDEEPPSGLDLPVASTVVPFGKSIEFLFSGDDPFQTGLEPGTIDVNRAAVIRGQVMTAGRVPVSGVTVSVLGYPEYGQTITREEAGPNFDLVVNGGGSFPYSNPLCMETPIGGAAAVRLVPEVGMLAVWAWEAGRCRPTTSTTPRLRWSTSETAPARAETT